MDNEPKNNLFKKILIGFLMFGFLLASSEITYIYNNKPSEFSIIYFKFINYYLEKDNFDKALTFLDKIANLHIREVYIGGSKENALIKITHKRLEVDYETKKQIKNLIQQNIPKDMSKKRSEEISNIYYHIGLILYNKKYIGDAISYLQTAVFLNPGLSFLHVEVANTYFNSGEYDNAMEILYSCLKNEGARNHCNDHINIKANNDQHEEVGQYSEFVDKYQKTK